MVAAREILSTLWRGGSYAYLWTDAGKESRWFKVDEPTTIPGAWANKNIYFGIHPCAEIPKTNASGDVKPPEQVRSQIRHIAAINCVFGEFDAKDEVGTREYAPFLPDDFDTLSNIAQKTAIKQAKEQAVGSDRERYKARAMERVSRCELPPTLIIDSGGGYHSYWFLTEPVLVTDANRTHIQNVQAAWVDMIGCDPVSKDLARVLRVPGTKNVKPQYAPDFPLVTVIVHDPGRLYRFGQIEALTNLDEVTLAGRKAVHDTRKQDQDKPSDDVITEFNRTHSLVDMLVDQGYTVGWDKPAVARLARPGREKGATSVIVFKDGEKEMSYHHSSSDPLYTIDHCRDAFDIETQVNHRGDVKAAYEAAKRAQGKWTEAKTGKRRDVDPDTGEILSIETVAPKSRTNGNGTNGNGHHAPVDKDQQEIAIDALAYRAEDGGVLDAWLEHYGNDWLFSVGPDHWRYWFDTHWKLDDQLMVSKQILDLMDTMNLQCSEFMREAPNKIKDISNKYATLGIDIPDSAIAQIENIKTKYAVAKSLHAATKRSSSRVGSVEIMARQQRALAVSKFDVDESLNLTNGVLSLLSLELRPHSRDEFFTYCLDHEYNQDADCPLFKKFISEVLVKEGTTETDESLVMLFQELLGYSMTPDVKHEVMVWMYGDGSNGKSVAISVIEALLGPMALSIDFQTIGLPGNYDLSDVPGKRVLFSTEAEKGKAMAESYIKRIVTGDTLSARPIYGSTIKFKSTAKIWWAMNDKPIIKDTTDAMWRRMKLIPFFRKFVEGKTADPDLTKKLLNELPGILNWALSGLIRLKLNNKFTYSAASEAAKAEYREEANPVAQWLNTMTVRVDHPATLAGALFENFRYWCEKSNERSITATQFGRDLTRLKVESKRVTTGVKYHLSLISGRE